MRQQGIYMSFQSTYICKIRLIQAGLFMPFSVILHVFRNSCLILQTYMCIIPSIRGVWCLSGRSSDSRERGQRFKTYIRHVVSLSKTFHSPKVLAIPRKLWHHPDRTEKLLTGTLSLNTNKTKKSHQFIDCLYFN